jgi:hypothetical protein
VERNDVVNTHNHSKCFDETNEGMIAETIETVETIVATTPTTDENYGTVTSNVEQMTTEIENAGLSEERTLVKGEEKNAEAMTWIQPLIGGKTIDMMIDEKIETETETERGELKRSCLWRALSGKSLKPISNSTLDRVPR